MPGTGENYVFHQEGFKKDYDVGNPYRATLAVALQAAHAHCGIPNLDARATALPAPGRVRRPAGYMLAC